MNNKAYIILGKRTPIGKYGGYYRDISAVILASDLIRKMLLLSPLKGNLDSVIIGNALSAGLGQNPARLAAMASGVPQQTPACTVNVVCGSGLKSIAMAVQSIVAEDADFVISGGMENMTRVPYYLEGYRFGVKFGNQKITDGMLRDGLECSLIGEHMGKTAENIAQKYSITRDEQDNFALRSHTNALLAQDKGYFKDEIIPVSVSLKGVFLDIDQDESPRRDSSFDKLAKLKTVFSKQGTVTAGNSSPLSDGAAAVFVASERYIRKNKVKPLARIVGWAEIGLDPAYMGLGAFYAAKECLKRAGMRKNQIDLWEINEAFASQSLAVIDLLGIDMKKVNVNGGAIALGHPIGASGTRILVTLLHELKRRGLKYGMASLCIGGGQGIAMIIESI